MTLKQFSSYISNNHHSKYIISSDNQIDLNDMVSYNLTMNDIKISESTCAIYFSCSSGNILFDRVRGVDVNTLKHGTGDVFKIECGALRNPELRKIYTVFAS